MRTRSFGLWTALLALGVYLTRRASWPVRVAFVAAMLVAAVAVGSLVSQATHYAPTTYYIDKDSVGGTCSDAYTLTQAQNASTPFCTMNALEDVVPTAGGWRIYVRRGTYPVWAIDSRSLADWGRVRPYPGEAVTLYGVQVMDSNKWDFQGFRVTVDLAAVCTTSGGCANETNLRIGGFFADNVTGLRVVGNRFEDALHGLVTKNPMRDVVFSGNYLKNMMCTESGADCDNGSPADDGRDGNPRNDQYEGAGIGNVSGTWTDFTIVNNVFEDMDSDAIAVGSCTRCRFDHNTFRGVTVDRPCKTMPSPCNTDHADSFQFASSGTDIQITRNDITQASKCFETGNVTGRNYRRWLIADNLCFNTTHAFNNFPRAEGLTFRNNVCWNTRYACIFAMMNNTQLTAAQNFRIYNNIFGICGNTDTPDCGSGDDSPGALSNLTSYVEEWRNNIVVEAGTGETYTGTDIVEPSQAQIDGLFVDVAGQDFRLPAASIAVGAGTSALPVSASDIRLKPRQVGTVDAGPYERQATDP